MGHVGDDELDLSNPPFPLTAIDREILATKDEDYHRTTWADLERIIANNQLEQLKRLPSDLHKYLRWSFATKKAYGSITNFVVQERLNWTPKTADEAVTAHSFSHHSSVPFEDVRDYAVLLNDWPYGFEAGIKHIVVWSRTPIEVDDERGDVTAKSKRVIEDFVERRFVDALAKEEGLSKDQAGERIMWFKNWVSLQSVRGVDHVHVLVRDAPAALLERWLVRTDQP